MAKRAGSITSIRKQKRPPKTKKRLAIKAAKKAAQVPKRGRKK